MVLENIVSNRLSLQPIGAAKWEVGNRATGFATGASPEEALNEWANKYAPNMLRKSAGDVTQVQHGEAVPSLSEALIDQAGTGEHTGAPAQETKSGETKGTPSVSVHENPQSAQKKQP